jgi:hypothetical protein
MTRIIVPACLAAMLAAGISILGAVGSAAATVRDHRVPMSERDPVPPPGGVVLRPMPRTCHPSRCPPGSPRR